MQRPRIRVWPKESESRESRPNWEPPWLVAELKGKVGPGAAKLRVEAELGASVVGGRARRRGRARGGRVERQESGAIWEKSGAKVVGGPELGPSLGCSREKGRERGRRGHRPRPGRPRELLSSAWEAEEAVRGRGKLGPSAEGEDEARDSWGRPKKEKTRPKIAGAVRGRERELHAYADQSIEIGLLASDLES